MAQSHNVTTNDVPPGRDIWTMQERTPEYSATCSCGWSVSLTGPGQGALRDQAVSAHVLSTA